MTEFDLIKKLTTYKVEAVAPFEMATTPEQWAELLPSEKLTTETDTAKYYLSHLSAFEKTATKIAFPECDLTNNDLCRAVEELTRGFDKKECRQLLDTLTPHKTRLARLCNEYKKIWRKPAPIEFICSLLESKLKAQKEIDPRLTTDEAKAYFSQAIELGLMDRDYDWLKGKEMLSCFAREMSIALGMGKGTGADGQPRIAWKPFESLFGVEKLRYNYNDIQKTGQSPSESYLIDGIFCKDETK